VTAGRLRSRLAELVGAASDGELTVGDVLAPGASLRDLGLDSLGYLRLVDAVEEEFGVALDPAADPLAFDSVDLLAARITAATEAAR
jgi:acyl carrier protein